LQKNTFYKLIIIVLMISLLAAGCGKNQAEELPEYKGSDFLMDTLVQMKVYAYNGDKIIDESLARIRELENLMSVTLEESEIYQINQHAGKGVQVSQDTLRVLNKALEYAELTKGSFDPSIGPLVELWGIGSGEERVPTNEEILKAKNLVDYRKVMISPDQKVRLAQPKMRLDLGAIAKGYAADEVSKIFAEHNINSAFVNLGGNVLVFGNKPDGSDWKVGIQDPRENRGNVMAAVSVSDKTIVTSGNYERYFEKDGVIYHHIIDPATGRPARTGLLSVSIISDSSFDADALSTSVFIMGLEAGKKLVNKLDGVEALFITDDLEVDITSGLKDKFELMSEDFVLIKDEN